jgi:hypothetical protein
VRFHSDTTVLPSPLLLWHDQVERERIALAVKRQVLEKCFCAENRNPIDSSKVFTFEHVEGIMPFLNMLEYRVAVITAKFTDMPHELMLMCRFVVFDPRITMMPKDLTKWKPFFDDDMFRNNFALVFKSALVKPIVVSVGIGVKWLVYTYDTKGLEKCTGTSGAAASAVLASSGAFAEAHTSELDLEEDELTHHKHAQGTKKARLDVQQPAAARLLAHAVTAGGTAFNVSPPPLFDASSDGGLLGDEDESACGVESGSASAAASELNASRKRDRHHQHPQHRFQHHDKAHMSTQTPLEHVALDAVATTKAAADAPDFADSQESTFPVGLV